VKKGFSKKTLIYKKTFNSRENKKNNVKKNFSLESSYFHHICLVHQKFSMFFFLLHIAHLDFFVSKIFTKCLYKKKFLKLVFGKLQNTKNFFNLLSVGTRFLRFFRETFLDCFSEKQFLDEKIL